MGAGGSAPQPKVITPGEAAQAAVGTQAAGEMMAVANQPVEQYANLATTTQLGPAEMQTQQALAGQAAMQAARQQMAVQAQVDPLAFAQRQMRLKAATDRLGQLYNVNPSQFTYNAPGAFQVADLAGVPPVGTLGQGARNVASNLSTAAVDYRGQNPQLIAPQNPRTYLA